MASELEHRVIAYLKQHIPGAAPGGRLALSADESPVFKTYIDNLLICYVVDEGSQLTLVQNYQLKERNLSPERLHECGVRNLHQVASKGVQIHPLDQCYGVAMGGNFEAGLILIDELWDHTFKSFVQGEFAIAIPDRDVLLFCDAAIPLGRQTLRDSIARCRGNVSHPLSDRVFVRKGNEWIIDE